MAASRSRVPDAVIITAVIFVSTCCNASAQDSNSTVNVRPKDVIVIGGLGIKGEEALYEQWNDTFSVYLTEVVGPQFGVTFKLVYLDFVSTYEAVKNREVDMVYTNPSAYACLEREYQASPIVSLRNRRMVGSKAFELDRFYGTIFVHINSTIRNIAEIANKTVEAVSLVGLGACQLQWDELVNRGIQFLSAPRQVRFSKSQKKIVKDVIAGAVDIGMVRTDLAEAMVSDGEIEPGMIRVLEDRRGRWDDPDFPFPHSTQLAAPEWTLGSLPWTNWNLSRAVLQALTSITPEHQAAKSGKYATWVAPLSSFGMHQMHSKLNWIDSNNRCVRDGDLCETVVCPPGQLKKSCEQILRGCEEIGEPCPEGYDCLCNPCSLVEDQPFVLKPLSVTSVLVNGTQLTTNWTLSQPCSKMQACLTVERADVVELQVMDRWLSYRATVGYAALEQVQYIWFADSVLTNWSIASQSSGAGDEFTISLPASELGSILLRVRACYTSGACAEIEDSPFLVAVIEKSCEGIPNFVPQEQSAKCVCKAGFEQPAGEFVCVEIIMSSSSDNSTTIIIAAVLSVLVVAIAVGGRLYYAHMHKQDESWKISLDELKFPEPRIVLGRGTYGQVLQADFRSTPVAVKRVLPKMHMEVDVTSSVGEQGLAPPPAAKETDGAKETSRPRRSDSADAYNKPSARFDSGGSQVSTTSQDGAAALPGVANSVSRINLRTKSMSNKGILRNKDSSRKRLVEGQYTDQPDEDTMGRNLTCPDDLGRESTNIRDSVAGRESASWRDSFNMRDSTSLIGRFRSDNRDSRSGRKASFDERNSLQIKQAWTSTGQARASEMQLQVRRQDRTESRDSLSGKAPAGASFSMKMRMAKGFSFSSKVSEAPSGKMTGTATTIDPVQLKNLTKEFLAEMQVMVFLRHPNIVTVMGAVVDNKSEPLMVMEYMKHGSLYDLMHNHTMQFDSEITMGILEGIVSGMMYLHSAKPPVLHNDLKSGNVLVGLNFAAKLADFGLSMKRKSSGFLGTPFWMAPELLNFGSQPSIKTDVYSFGVTLYELLTRKEPYEEHDNVQDVLDMLGDPEMDPPLRPTLPEGLPEDAAAIMCACWDVDPDMRPSFEQIKVLVSQLNMKDMDVWLGRENHTSQGKRTANQLLYDVFPPHIADTLRQGKKVDPEHHEVVTIFFSDIVGFTDISRALQPIEVMDMLDRLYFKFDAIARKHDIFKVETIGDAYMAVANLVKEQQNHTERIAKFAMEAIQTANETMIKEDQPHLGCVNIRVGFHSGPVVSSVVGNMNPRFCLFGDTVNTSSRMESNSEKNRIHMSDSAATLLMEQAPNARLTSRGVIPIKGKGDMRTYWLDGFEDMDARITHMIPEVAQEASLTQ